MHFVLTGHYLDQYYLDLTESRLRYLIHKGMQDYKLEHVMVTSILIEKYRLITKKGFQMKLFMNFSRFRRHHFENQPKEKKNQYCLGKDYVLRESVNDDFESLLENISIGIEPENFAKTYFLPKLTEEEMKLVERKNPEAPRRPQTSK